VLSGLVMRHATPRADRFLRPSAARHGGLTVKVIWQKPRTGPAWSPLLPWAPPPSPAASSCPPPPGPSAPPALQVPRCRPGSARSRRASKLTMAAAVEFTRPADSACVRGNRGAGCTQACCYPGQPMCTRRGNGPKSRPKAAGAHAGLLLPGGSVRAQDTAKGPGRMRAAHHLSHSCHPVAPPERVGESALQRRLQHAPQLTARPRARARRRG
jgi:hypothetical protein